MVGEEDEVVADPASHHSTTSGRLLSCASHRRTARRAPLSVRWCETLFSGQKMPCSRWTVYLNHHPEWVMIFAVWFIGSCLISDGCTGLLVIVQPFVCERFAVHDQPMFC